MDITDILAKFVEAATKRVKDSFGAVRDSLYTALHAKYSPDGQYPYIRDVFPDSVVYEIGDKTFLASYSVKDGVVTLGEISQVEVAYIPATSTKVKESEFTGDVIQFKERAISRDGKARIKVIQPGQGSMAYYPKEVLKRDGPKVFTKGLHMYLDHQTEAQEAEMPENSLRNLAGILESDAEWDENGPEGPGLYADANVYSDFREFLDERSKDIGVSIRAGGTGKHGQVGGKPTTIVESLTFGKSVDFVTLPGAGGKLLELYESQRQTGRNPQQEHNDMAMTDQEKAEFTRLQEAAAKVPKLEVDLSRFRERVVTTLAGALLTEALGETELTDKGKDRVRRLVGRDFPLTEAGDLDEAKFKAAVKAAIDDEVAYLSEAGVKPTGKVTGMGDGTTAPPAATAAKGLKERQDAALATLVGKK